MTIGIDISALQSAHRMRGIGFTVINFINYISEEDRRNNKYALFVFEQGSSEALELLNLEGLNYELRFLKPKGGSPKAHAKSRLIGRFQRLFRSTLRQLGELSDRYTGDSRVKDLSGIEVFIQPDQSQSVPRGLRVKKVLIIYDVIPYVLERDYLWSYRTARRIHGFSRLAALRCHIRRWLYLKKIKINSRRADKLLAISHHTKKDFIRVVGVNTKKIKVVHLGVSQGEKSLNKDMAISYKRYITTSWGYIPRTYKLEGKIPFLLFVGGADQRRRLDHLVTAFNHLRAQGRDMRLILAGDSMQGPKNIATLQVQNALLSSSYIEDIIFMGFVSDEVRESLYEKALALVYPSTYEGFGLPILEAMKRGTPVITYRNSSIPEVADDSVIYADDYFTIMKAVEDLLGNQSLCKKYSDLGKKRAVNFSWHDTSKNILSIIESL